MHEIAIAVRQLLAQLLRALGISERASDDRLVVGLGTFIIFGLLLILTLKILLVRRVERRRRYGEQPPQPAPTAVQRNRAVLRALFGIGLLLAISLLIALRLNS
jgi:hypothetical protein